MVQRKHVFISHHHRDDKQVDRFTSLMKDNGHDVRNSSIRAKPANQRRLDKGLVKDATIKRLLRMKMRWASTVVVLIGPKTHSRPWVDWEINKANEMGKRIVGVYVRGGTEAEVPKALEDYGSAIVNWNSKSIVDAVEGKSNSFEAPGGGERPAVHELRTSSC